MAFVIREGDPTTTGGKVVKGSTNTTIEYQKAARISDPVWCPKCSSMGFIAEGNPTVIDEFVAIATHGHAVQCGCPFGSNRLISTQTSTMAAEDVSVAIAPDFAAKAQAATHIWAQAIRDGSYKSEFTADIPTNNLSGYAPRKLCVFAKSCTVPAGSIEAGKGKEPADNFGKVAVLGAVGAPASVEAGFGGITYLGRIAGQLGTEGLGTWALRSAVTAGSVASGLLLAFLPRDIADGSLYTEEQLRSMSEAATRVRFQFRRDEKGEVQVYGIHTAQSSGMASVAVVNAQWSADKQHIEAHVGGVTIIWTPNDGPIITAPTPYPGVSDELSKVLVHPIVEDTDSQIEIYPAENDITWQDCILVFPPKSGVPPLYIVFSKPAVKPLEVGVYKDLSSRSVKDTLDIDHITSQAALRTYIVDNFDNVTPEEIKYLLSQAPCIAIPQEVHRKYSETYAGRNVKTKQRLDASNLKAAVDSNFDAVKRGLLKDGYAEGDIERAREELHNLHKEQGWYK